MSIIFNVFHNRISVKNGFMNTLKNNTFIYSPANIQAIFQRKIYVEIIKSAPFRRLKNIHFLGAVDYALGGKQIRFERQNTRYHHSIGVARLALKFAKLRNFTEADEVLCVLSALLHDIGHAPFSHSMESVFMDRFNFGHHLASEKILRGEVEQLSSVWRIIEKYNINIFRILEILNGVGEQKFKDAFDYPINIDTAEGILRCCQLTPDYDLVITPEEVVEELACLSDRSSIIFDQFWRAKDHAYKTLIYSKLGIMADHLCQDYMRSSQNVSEDFFYDSEVNFRKKHVDIFKILDSLEVSIAQDMFCAHIIDYNERMFDINTSVQISHMKDLKCRYTQRKTKKHLEW